MCGGRVARRSFPFATSLYVQTPVEGFLLFSFLFFAHLEDRGGCEYENEDDEDYDDCDLPCRAKMAITGTV